MRITGLSIAVIGAVLLPSLHAAPSHAQATRTWVSGVGDDVNPCSRTAPCKTFAGAFSKTAPGGIINCLDPGGFGAITITRSLTIDCEGTFAGVLAALTNGINVNAAATDVVTLRNLSIEGVGTGLIGVNFIAGGVLRIERCKIFGFRSGSAIGLNFSVPTGFGSELYVSDTVVSDNGSSATNGGIVVKATGTATASVSLNRVRVDNNSAGLRVDSTTGGTGTISLSMRDSTAAGNSNSGITVISTAARIVAAFDNVAAISNGTGLVADGAATRALVTRVTAVANNVGVSTANSGQVISYLDNHINNNITTNGAPTATQVPQ